MMKCPTMDPIKSSDVVSNMPVYGPFRDQPRADTVVDPVHVYPPPCIISVPLPPLWTVYIHSGKRVGMGPIRYGRGGYRFPWGAGYRSHRMARRSFLVVSTQGRIYNQPSNHTHTHKNVPHILWIPFISNVCVSIGPKTRDIEV
jgi:hypothetical protein